MSAWRAMPRIVVMIALAALPLDAQVVRGRVTEGSSTLPVPGALASLLQETADSALASTLTTQEGEYALRAPAPGRYRLSMKRIGVRRFVSAPFDITEGETRVVDVSLDPVAMALPEVTVVGLCATNPRELRRISSLWDEARTALEATEISQRERLISATISRYAGELDPPSLRVLFDWRSDAQLLVQQPFTSLSGDSLSAVGYWRQLPGDSVEFLAPDASALGSNAFIRDHCFALAGAPRGRPDLVGLRFVPARDRKLPDISGTVWLDARRFELRFIEFRYTQLPEIPNADRVGGEVHFARLGSGAWIVDRWFIRMPQVVVPAGGWTRRQLREEGGAVIADGLVLPTRPATLVGSVRDSSGKPIADAVVRAIGTHRQVLTGADGSFRFDSLPPGGLSVVAHTDAYDAFAVLASARRVDLQAGRVQRIELRALNTGALRREVCPAVWGVTAGRPYEVRGVLRLLMVDSATAVPLPGVRFIASWPVLSESAAQTRTQAVTDSRGAATFCDLPIGPSIQVSVLSAGTPVEVMTTRIPRNGVVGRVIMGRVNR